MMNLALFSSTYSRLKKNRMRLFLHLIVGLTIGLSFNSTQAFTDLPATDPHFSALAHLDEVNVMNSRGGAFFPDQLVTRAEALTIALRAGGISLPAEFDGNTYYSDVDPNQWYAPVVARAVETKVLKARNQNFWPDQVVGKAEFLTMLF